MHMVGRIVLGLVLVAVLAGGVALFVIARQDDSRSGQLVGAVLGIVGIVGLMLLIAGRGLF